MAAFTGFIGCIRWIYWLLLAGLLSLDLLAAFAGPSLTVFAAANKLRFLSMITIDTMETMDDNPGTGRTVDKYFFQPIGRKIERFAMRITIASLPPWKITQYLDDNLELYSGIPHCKVGIGQALTFLGRLKRGSTVITGLKSLVKQTR